MASPATLPDKGNLFYGLVFDTAGQGTVAFIKKADPVKAARRSRAALLGHDVLTMAPEPTMALSHDIDLVVTPDHVFVLSKSAFDAMLNDVAIAMRDVPLNIDRTTEALKATVPLGLGAVELHKVS